MRRGRTDMSNAPSTWTVVAVVLLAVLAGAATLGVSFEKPPTEKKTATQGWYANIAFEEAAVVVADPRLAFDAFLVFDEERRHGVDEVRPHVVECSLPKAPNPHHHLEIGHCEPVVGEVLAAMRGEHALQLRQVDRDGTLGQGLADVGNEPVVAEHVEGLLQHQA